MRQRLFVSAVFVLLTGACYAQWTKEDSLRLKKSLKEGEELKLNKERGLYDASKLLSMKLILKTLEQYRQQLVKDNRLDPDEAFAFIKASFAKDTEERKQLIQTAAAYLENAFAFMESAFGESQEMVIFITELNANKYCARFIRDNGSAKYDRYNKSLLFDEKRENLLRDIGEASEFAAFLD